ncbi:MAG: carboxypeptidase M32, partial [Promethearchaeota archaeon]
RVAHEMTELMGYDTTSDQAGGRIDEVLHPFTVGYYDDIRITMHYQEADPINGVLTILHEAGHALYEQNLKREWKWQPIGVASSFGVHESISRFYENVVGRSVEFWDYCLPRLNDSANNAFGGADKTEFARALNQVRPSKIRVTADEVTYSLHIIIRFEIERDLFAGKIQVSELPEIWNQKYEEYLGLSIDSFAEGVMQDSHWSNGNFGYFPSYALGNIYGGMWLESMSSDLFEWRSDVQKGNLSRIQNWLVTKLMHKSNLYDPANLIRKVTGKELTAQPFLSYLDDKYTRLFQ